MSAEVPRPPAELPRLLGEHLDMLVSLCNLYDSGKMHAAPLIAANLRVLLHQTSNSYALLFQLHSEDAEFCDTDKASVDGDPAVFCMQAGMAYAYGLQSGGLSVETWSPTLLLFDIHRHRTPFNFWWRDKIIAFAPNVFSRRDFVMALANKDGGSHVSPKLERPYFELTRGNSTGVQLSVAEGDALETPSSLFKTFQKDDSGRQAARAIVRQIAHEVVLSLLKNVRAYERDCRRVFTPPASVIFIRGYTTEPVERRHHWKRPEA